MAIPPTTPPAVSGTAAVSATSIAADYSARIVTAGGTISPASITAFQSALVPLIASGVWDKLKELWIPAGDQLAAALVKLKTPGVSALINANFVSTDYTEASALYPGAANTNKKLTSDFVPTSNGISASNAALGAYILSGSYTGGPMGSSDSSYWPMYAGTGEAKLAGTTITTIVGMRLKSVVSTGGTVYAYAQNALEGSGSAGTTAPNGTLTVFSINGGFFCNARVGGYYAAAALTAPELRSLSQFFDAVSLGLGRAICNNTAVFFGDSITEGLGASVPARAWAALVAGDVGLTEVNKGASGTVLENTTPVLPGNGRDRYIEDVLTLFPQYVFILYGLNDERYNSVAFTTTAFELSYSQIIEGLLGAGYQPCQLILGSPPYVSPTIYASDAPFDGNSLARQQNFRTSVKTVAAKYGCVFRDVYQTMLDASGSGILSSDLLHPSDIGHALIAQCMLGRRDMTRNESINATFTGGVGYYRIANKDIVTASIMAGKVRVVATDGTRVSAFQVECAGLSSSATVRLVEEYSMGSAGGVITKVRISTDSGGALIGLDLYQANATSPNVYAEFVGLFTPVAAPVVGASSGGTGSTEITLSQN